MGLDLILYKHIKDNMTWEEEQAAELAYGRKTWSIAEFFQRRCESLEGDWYYKVRETDWNEFIDSLGKLNEPEFRKRVEKCINRYENIDEDELDEEFWKEYDTIEEWYDGAVDNDSGYTLGFDWELRAVLNWFDADAEVHKAFADGEDIRLIVSY